jgi:heptosyltransferase-2
LLKFKSVEIKKILAIRTDRLGEFILTLPAIHAIKAKFPNAHLALMLNPYNIEIVEGNPDIDEIIKYSEDEFRGLRGTLRLAQEIKKCKFDAVVIFNPKQKFNLATFLARVPVRVGYDRKWGFLLNRKIPDLKFLGIKHEIEYNFDLVKLIGIDCQKQIFPIALASIKDHAAEQFLCKVGISDTLSLIAIHPWASNPLKEWPHISFIELSRKIIDELGFKVVIIAGEDAIGRTDNFVKQLNRKVINLAGQTTLKELATILSRVRLLITNDSGPMHVAASQNVPVVALFRKEPVSVSAKRWGPVGANHIVIENEFIADILVEEVFNGVKKILQR